MRTLGICEMEVLQAGKRKISFECALSLGLVGVGFAALVAAGVATAGLSWAVSGFFLSIIDVAVQC